MNEILHQIAMWLIFLGALVLFYLAVIWFARGNIIMGVGMLSMGIIATSNFYLHRRMMKMNTKKEHE